MGLVIFCHHMSRQGHNERQLRHNLARQAPRLRLAMDKTQLEQLVPGLGAPADRAKASGVVMCRQLADDEVQAQTRRTRATTTPSATCDAYVNEFA